MNEPINAPIQEEKKKERVITFYSQLKSDSGHVEIKFDFEESEFKKLSQQGEQEGDLKTSTFGLLCGIDKLKSVIEEITGKEVYTTEFSTYEEPPKK